MKSKRAWGCWNVWNSTRITAGKKVDNGCLRTSEPVLWTSSCLVLPIAFKEGWQCSLNLPRDMKFLLYKSFSSRIDKWIRVHYKGKSCIGGKVNKSRLVFFTFNLYHPNSQNLCPILMALKCPLISTEVVSWDQIMPPSYSKRSPIKMNRTTFRVKKVYLSLTAYWASVIKAHQFSNYWYVKEWSGHLWLRSPTNQIFICCWANCGCDLEHRVWTHTSGAMWDTITTLSPCPCFQDRIQLNANMGSKPGS